MFIVEQELFHQHIHRSLWMIAWHDKNQFLRAGKSPIKNSIANKNSRNSIWFFMLCSSLCAFCSGVLGFWYFTLEPKYFSLCWGKRDSFSASGGGSWCWWGRGGRRKNFLFSIHIFKLKCEEDFWMGFFSVLKRRSERVRERFMAFVRNVDSVCVWKSDDSAEKWCTSGSIVISQHELK